MSPSRGSLRKKHVSMPATPTKISSKRLTFDKTDVEDTLQTQPQSIDLEMQPLCTATEDVLTNQLPRFKKFVSVHRHNIAPSTVSIQISTQVEQPASVKSKSTGVYLAKQLNPSEIAALERSVATKEPTAVAHIVMVKTPVVLYAVKREMVNSLSESCKKNLCRRTNGSVLYKKDYNEMSEFEFDNVWKEIVKFAPFFIDILNAVAGEMCDLADTPASLRVKYCLIYSILMNQRWHELSLLQRINTVLMIRGGSSKQKLIRFLITIILIIYFVCLYPILVITLQFYLRTINYVKVLTFACELTYLENQNCCLGRRKDDNNVDFINHTNIDLDCLNRGGLHLNRKENQTVDILALNETRLHPDIPNVFRLLNNLSISKSTGCDKIPAKILKKSASVITPSLTNLFNSAIGMGIFPSEWKIARVIPLHKKAKYFKRSLMSAFDTIDLRNVNVRLSLNLVKTEYLLIGSRHNINIHIDQISKKISSGISAMKKIKDFTNSDTLKDQSERLQKLHNRCARIIMNFKDEPGQSQLALDQLGWISLEERRKHNMARLMFKNSNHIHSYNLRGSNSSLFLPRPNTEYGRKCFRYSGVKIWNSIPEQSDELAICDFVFYLFLCPTKLENINSCRLKYFGHKNELINSFVEKWSTSCNELVQYFINISIATTLFYNILQLQERFHKYGKHEIQKKYSDCEDNGGVKDPLYIRFIFVLYSLYIRFIFALYSLYIRRRQHNDSFPTMSNLEAQIQSIYMQFVCEICFRKCQKFSPRASKICFATSLMVCETVPFHQALVRGPLIAVMDNILQLIHLATDNELIRIGVETIGDREQVVKLIVTRDLRLIDCSWSVKDLKSNVGSGQKSDSSLKEKCKYCDREILMRKLRDHIFTCNAGLLEESEDEIDPDTVSPDNDNNQRESLHVEVVDLTHTDIDDNSAESLSRSKTSRRWCNFTT
ncbi:Hypothetical predicted protein, partial [Paramuricea clavata]